MTATVHFDKWDDVPLRLRDGFAFAMKSIGGHPEKMDKNVNARFEVKYDITTHRKTAYTENEDKVGFLLEGASK